MASGKISLYNETNSSTITATAGSGITIETFIPRQTGNIVQFILRFSCSSNLTRWSTIVTFNVKPVGYVPAFIFTDTYTLFGTAFITDSSGQLTVGSTNLPAGTYTAYAMMVI